MEIILTLNFILDTPVIVTIEILRAQIVMTNSVISFKVHILLILRMKHSLI